MDWGEARDDELLPREVRRSRRLLVVTTELDPDPPDQAAIHSCRREWQTEHVLAGKDRRVVAVAEEASHNCQKGRCPGEDGLDLGPGLGDHAGGGMAVSVAVVLVVLDFGSDQEHHQIDQEHGEHDGRAADRAPDDRHQEVGERQQALAPNRRGGDVGQGLIVRHVDGSVDQHQQGRQPAQEQVPVDGHKVLAVGHTALGGGQRDAAGGGSSYGSRQGGLQLAVSGRLRWGINRAAHCYPTLYNSKK